MKKFQCFCQTTTKVLLLQLIIIIQLNCIKQTDLKLEIFLKSNTVNPLQKFTSFYLFYTMSDLLSAPELTSLLWRLRVERETIYTYILSKKCHVRGNPVTTGSQLALTGFRCTNRSSYRFNSAILSYIVEEQCIKQQVIQVCTQPLWKKLIQHMQPFVEHHLLCGHPENRHR